MRTPTATSTASEERTAFGWVDAVVLLAIFGLLWSVLHFGRGMLVHFDERHMPPLSTNLSDIPYYAGRTVLRMWIAFACSLLFTLIVGSRAAIAPHEEDPVFPVEWRVPVEEAREFQDPAGRNWRFRVPDREVIGFYDGNCGDVSRMATRDFGDFLIWNRDNIPAYELAVVVDDLAMGVTEIVRGEDLLTSTARQILLYRALDAAAPSFFHCPLALDKDGRRLAKRDASLSLRALRERGCSAEWVIAQAKALTARDLPSQRGLG